MKATFVKRHKEADYIFSFWFKPAMALNQIAGQFIELTIKHPHPDERGIKHWFTVSSSPTDGPLFSITTKFNRVRSSSFKIALEALKPIDDVIITEPMGDFVLPKDPTRPLVFVAGGIGITPFHSIIKWLYDTKQERDITFLYSVSSEHQMVFQDLFERYGMKRVILVEQPEKNWNGPTGRLSAERILELTKPGKDSLIYISGPEPMVESLNNQLKASGWPNDQLVGDYFPGYTSV